MENLLSDPQAPPNVDRRARGRSMVGISMLARWKDARDHELMVLSRDISDDGIFLHAAADIALGTEIEIILTRPSDPEVTGNKRLRVWGTVVRAEPGCGKPGYALKLTRSQILDPQSDPALQALRRFPLQHASRSSSRLRNALILFLFLGAVLAGLIVVGGAFGIRPQHLRKIFTQVDKAVRKVTTLTPIDPNKPRGRPACFKEETSHA